MIDLSRPLHRLAVVASSLSLLITGGCETQSGSGHRRPVSAGEVAPSRPATAPLAGDRRSRADRMLAAGIAAVPTASVAPSVDREEHQLRIKTAGTGIDLGRTGDEITLSVPAAICFDGVAIRPGIRTTLDQVGRTLAQYPSGFVDVYGYGAGEDEAATRLSQAHAEAIAAYLQMRGVAAARLAARSLNSDKGGAGGVQIRLVPLTEADLPPPATSPAATVAR